MLPLQFYEKAGYFAVNVMRRSFDFLTGYNEKNVSGTARSLTVARSAVGVASGSSMAERIRFCGKRHFQCSDLQNHSTARLSTLRLW